MTYLRLAAGTYTMGVTAGFARTDDVDDDGWKLFCGVTARDFFGVQVAEFQRTGVPFPSALQERKGNATEFTVNAPVDGVYPFRLVHWQTGHKTLLEWYVVQDPDSDTPTRYLINDGNAGDPIAFRSVDVAAASAPSIVEVSPLPGSAGVSPSASVETLLFDGVQAVNESSIKMFLNGSPVTPQVIARSGNQVRVSYKPNATRADPANSIRLDFKDSANQSQSRTWAFTSVVAGGARTIARGQWDFDQGDLSATIGKPLQFFGGLGGTAATKTEFGYTTDFGIDDINGVPARVMKVPGDLDRNIGYVMTHGIPANGGGTLVNQYTLIMDVWVDTKGPGAASLIQINSDNNTDDGDLFWQGNNFGQGGGGYNGTSAFTPGKWHRIVAAYDEAANPPVVTKYVDGIKQDDWTANQGLDKERRSLKPTAILFGDGDQDERRLMYVNSVQIREGKMSDGEMVLLGGADAAGIPVNVESVNVAGQWDFDAGNLAATVGTPLQFFGGNAGVAKAKTEFGLTSDFGIDDIDGVPAKVMKVPGDLDRGIGYVMTHGISPNGGGTLVNQYTLVMDVWVDTKGPGAASLLQINSLDNTDDGDLFWQGNNFGQGGGGYNGTSAFTPGKWHRIVAAYDEAANPPVVTKYVDGIKQDDWTANQGLDKERRALKPTAILFGDGDQDERRMMYVNSIQIRSGKLSDAQLTLLGGPSAAGIPLVIQDAKVSGQWDFDKGTLAATIGKPLEFFQGAGGAAETRTEFGDTTTLGVADINGETANVMVVPGDLDRNIGYVMSHGIAPNGGGSLVNQYTLIMDVMIDTKGPGAASLIQINSDNNTDDGDLFWQGNNFGQGGGGYNGTGAFKPGSWHRIAAAYDMAATPPRVTKYVDGIFQDDWTANQGLDKERRALKPTAILFGDGDQDERRKMWVNSIQIRAGALSKPELESLGGPSAAGIPIGLPPRLDVSAKGGVHLSWSAAAVGYVLEVSSSLITPDWQPVPTAQLNSATLVAGAPAQYFRLRKL